MTTIAEVDSEAVVDSPGLVLSLCSFVAMDLRRINDSFDEPKTLWL